MLFRIGNCPTIRIMLLNIVTTKQKEEGEEKEVKSKVNANRASIKK